MSTRRFLLLLATFTYLILANFNLWADIPPFANDWHDDFEVNPWGILKHANSNSSINLNTGQIHHNGWVDSQYLSGIGIAVIDAIYTDFSVPTSGYYSITYQGHISGGFWNVSSTYFVGAAKGATDFWLETKITQIPSSYFKKTLHKTDLSAGALVETLGETAIWSLVGVGDFVGAISTLQSLAIPEAAWNSSHFSMTSHVYLEGGQTYSWLFQVNSITACASIVVASNVTTLDVDVTLEEVEINLVNASGNNPVLYNPWVSPQSGTTVTNYEYTVDYHDVDGDSPDYVRVFIDGGPYDMSLESGIPSSGAYRYQTNLSTGQHEYYFATMDSQGGVATTNTYSGPSVGTGTSDDLELYSLRWDDDDPSDGDHVPETGEDVQLEVCLKNTSSQELTGIIATLTTSIGNVDITDDTVVYGTISSAGKSWAGDEFDMFLDFASTWYNLPFTLNLTYMKGGSEYQQAIPFTKTFYEDGQLEPIFEVDHTVVDDSKWGDNDGIPESGEDIEFDLYIKNIGNATATNVEVLISNISIGSVDQGWEEYPDITPGSVVQQESGDFSLRSMPSTFASWVTADVTVRCAGNPDKLIANCSLFEFMPSPWLQVTPDEWDFGVSSTADDITKMVTINNIGTGILDIISIIPSHPSDTSTSWSGSPFSIPPGGSDTIDITIETSALQGLISCEVVVNVGTEVHISNDRISISGLVSDSVPYYQVPNAAVGYSVDVSGNIVVWEENRNGNSDIFAYDLSTGTEIAVCTDSSSQFNHRISGNLVAWIDWRNDDGSWTNGDIYGFDLVTGQEFAISTDPMDEDLLGVDDNLVAFIRDYYVFTEPTVYDTARNLFVYEYQGDGQFTERYTTNFTVTPGHDPKQSVSDDGDFGDGFLVFERHENYWESGMNWWSYRDKHLEKIDFAFGETAPSSILFGQRDPYSATAHRFVYKENDGDDDQVWLWDNGSTSQLTSESVNHAGDFLAIGNSVVVYNKSGQNGIFGYDLGTSLESLITDMEAEYARMDGNLLVWKKLSAQEVYYSFLNQADLSVGSADIIFNDEHPLEGSSIDIDVTIHNLNPWDTTADITVQLYDGEPNGLSNKLGSDEIVSGGIASQSSAVVSFTSIPVGVEGIHAIYAVIEVSGNDNPANNKAYKILSVSDTDTQGPMISNVITQEYSGDGDNLLEEDEQILITWQASDISGIDSSWLTVDANDINASGTYYVVIGPYSAGEHNYTISATDGDLSSETSIYSDIFRVVTFDLNDDGPVNLIDFAQFSSEWSNQPCNSGNNWCNYTDYNSDGHNDIVDLALFALHWLEGIAP